MHDDYLWDRTGSDVEIEAIERTLAPLRYEPGPLRLTPVEPTGRATSSRTWIFSVAAAAAAAALVLGLLADDAPRTTVVSVFGPLLRIEAPAPVEPGPKSVTPEPEPEPEDIEPDQEPVENAGAAGNAKSRLAPGRPMRLSSAQIREGVRAVKTRAQACGETHGAEPGTLVKVKMSISGDTGRVVSARAQSPFSGTPLGRCVAKALSKARFPRFRKQEVGVLYPVVVGRAQDTPKVSCIRGEGNCDVDPELPKTLSAAQIRDGVAAVKSKAAACGAEHGATPGTRVKVKLSIAGKTGRVTSASALSPWREEPLGICVAKALSKARFGRFQKDRLGVVYPISVEAGP